MRKILTSICVIIFALNLSNGQDIDNCTPSHDRALFMVKYYLTASDLNEDRIKTGTNNIPIEQVKHVDNEVICKKLDAIVTSNAKFNEINKTTKRTKFFYQTNDFYYIFWDYIDGKLRTGSKRVFIVVNKSFVVVGVSYV